MKAIAFSLSVLIVSGCAAHRVPIEEGFEAVLGVVVGNAESPTQAYTESLKAYKSEPDYACRQPIFSAFFHPNGVSRIGEELCSERTPIVVQTQYDGAKVMWLDPARVRSIHLLFASKSPRLASQFGHVALRLVVCPAVDSSDQDCDLNLNEHLTLSFQAHIDDYSLNTIKALQGNYRAYLFASQFMDTYQQYAIGEFRELYSLPLRLDPRQRSDLVRGLVEIHWQYSGDYNFFTNNCSTLLQDALSVSWPDYSNNKAMSNTHLRPDKFFDAIRVSTLADGKKLESLVRAERDGFYFSSTRPFYDAAVADVIQHIKSPGFSTLEEYISIDPGARRQMLSEADNSEMFIKTPHTKEAQLMLEEYAILYSERLLRNKAAEYFEQQNFNARLQAINNGLDFGYMKILEECLLRPLSQKALPPRRLVGIPKENDDFADIPGPTQLCMSKQGQRMLADAIEAVEDKDSMQWKQLKIIAQYRDASIENADYLKKMQ